MDRVAKAASKVVASRVVAKVASKAAAKVASKAAAKVVSRAASKAAAISADSACNLAGGLWASRFLVVAMRYPHYRICFTVAMLFNDSVKCR